MEKNIVKLEVMGQSLLIQSPEDPSYITEVAEYLKQKLSDIQKASRITDPVKVALMAALNLVDELFKEKALAAHKMNEGNGSVDDREIEEITRRMLSTINRSLDESPEE